MDQRTRLAGCVWLCVLVLAGTLCPGFDRVASATAAVAVASPEFVSADAGYDALNDLQRPVRDAVFGVLVADDVLNIDLAGAPVALTTTAGSEPVTGIPIVLDTAYIGPEIVSRLSNVAAGQFKDGLTEHQTTAFSIFGTLTGPLGSTGFQGLYLTGVDPESEQAFKFILPIQVVEPEGIQDIADAVELVLAGASLGTGPIGVASTPCDDIGSCQRAEMQAMAAALQVLADCTAPLLLDLAGLIYCAVACKAASLFFPAIFVACMVACGIAVTLMTLLQFLACKEAFDIAQANARSTYCACMNWKHDHCDPSEWEPDKYGCISQ